MAITLKFKNKLWKVGSSKVVTIPQPIARLLEDKQYTFVIKDGDEGWETNL